MKLVFVRHGDPDYRVDGLTEQGVKEAKLLAPRMPRIKADEYYVSPYGRAKMTAQLALEGSGIEPTELWWLREFDYRVMRPDDQERGHVPWDWLPKDWTVVPERYDAEKWFTHPAFVEAGIEQHYRETTMALDAFLLQHGYRRNGRMYKAEKANNDTLVFFCHFGLTALAMAHLLTISPMVIWQGFCAPPTSVTTLVTEERREGDVQWRCIGYGDTSHLYAGGMEPGFSGRFCECFGNENERHD